MARSHFEHKTYYGSIEVSVDDDFCLHGQILFINDLVTYEAQSLKELDQEFKTAVDDYIETCKQLGRKPQKPYKGSFNVRIGWELHKAVAVQAKLHNVSLNEFVKEAISAKIQH